MIQWGQGTLWSVTAQTIGLEWGPGQGAERGHSDTVPPATDQRAPPTIRHVLDRRRQRRGPHLTRLYGEKLTPVPPPPAYPAPLSAQSAHSSPPSVEKGNGVVF